MGDHSITIKTWTHSPKDIHVRCECDWSAHYEHELNSALIDVIEKDHNEAVKLYAEDI